jgi:hypothetical protein
MSNLDARIVRVGIEVNGELRMYEGLDVKASGVKYANPLQNECEVRITNLAKTVRDYLLTETSPFNGNKSPKRLIVEAGRASIGAFRLFEGDIISCAPTQAPDIALTIKAKTGQASKGKAVAVSQAPQTRLSKIAKEVAGQLGLSLVFEATDKSVANFAFSGAALKLVDKLAEVGGVNAYVDDAVLVVKDTNEPLRAVSHELSAATGLVGLPEITEQGVKVTYLLEPKSKLGGELKLKSEVNPAATGDYTIYKLAFEISSRDTAFYWIAECARKGYTPKKKAKEKKPEEAT